MIKGLSHLTFIVRDLEKMEQLLTQGLGARKVYESGDRQFSLSPERFFLLGSEPGLWIAIMQGESLAEESYNHVAFQVDDDALGLYRHRLLSLGYEVSEGRSRVAGEGRSLYFRDDDLHLFELHSGSLAERLRRYRCPSDDHAST